MLNFNKVLLGVLFGSPLLLLGGASMAQSDLSSEELQNLCSNFPMNSQCEGYDAPVALDDRDGEEMTCLIGIDSDPTDCKVSVVEDELRIYSEVGDSLSILEGEKDTEEAVLASEDINSFAYTEDEKTNVGVVVALGVWGLLLPKDIAQLQVKVEPGTDISRQLTIIAPQDDGRELRRSLEDATGQEAELFF